MSSTAPVATGAAPEEPLLRRLMRATEVDTRMIGMVAAITLIWVGFHIYTYIQTGEGLFLTPRNLWNLTVQTSSVAVMATGMVLVIVMRHIDLSVGAIVAFVSTIVGVTQIYHPAALSRSRQSRDMDHLDCVGVGSRLRGRRAEWGFDRLSRHPRLHRHPGRPVVLARRGVVGDVRRDDRAARQPFLAHRRRAAKRLDRRPGELEFRDRHLSADRRRSLFWPSAARPLQFSAPADVGGDHRRRCRLLLYARRDRGRQRLSVARARRRALRGSAQHPRPRGRPDHRHRLCDPGADRTRRRPHHDVRRQSHAVWPLRLRDRRQSGGRRARRHQHAAHHRHGLRLDGHARRHLGLHRTRRASIRRPTRLARSTSSTSSPPPSSAARR